MKALMSLFGLAFLLGGLLLMRRPVTMALRSTKWPAVPGVVLSAERVYAGESAEDGEPTYHAKVVYAYEVDGRKYRGSLVDAFPFLKSAAQAARVVEGYPVGADVEVYFDPEQPSSSLLEPGLDGLTKAFLVIYLVCTVLLAVDLFVKIPYSDGL